MNWITKVLKFGEKIKTVIKKDQAKKKLKIVIGYPAVRDQF